MASKTAKRTRGPLGGLIELLFTVGIAVGVAFVIQALVVKPYRIPSASMEPTIHIGQRVLANRLDTHPKLGSIVVFHPPAGANPEGSPVCGDPRQGTDHAQACDQPTHGRSTQTFIKRVVGLPGDRISIHDGHVIRDGRRENAPYARSCGGPACNFPRTITVPPGDYFMMGDNRGDSDDSRFWGPVPQTQIVGVAILTYWPPDRIGTL